MKYMLLILVFLVTASLGAGSDKQTEQGIVVGSANLSPRNTRKTAVRPTLKNLYGAELPVIRIAANRNKCTGDLFYILLAIRKAENGAKGIEFGVMHPKAKDTNLDTQAGWAAATVVKNYQRWIKAGKPKGYIEFLGDRYCPPTAHELNKHWVRNVKFWYRKLKG